MDVERQSCRQIARYSFFVGLFFFAMAAALEWRSRGSVPRSEFLHWDSIFGVMLPGVLFEAMVPVALLSTWPRTRIVFAVIWRIALGLMAAAPLTLGIMALTGAISPQVAA